MNGYACMRAELNSRLGTFNLEPYIIMTNNMSIAGCCCKGLVLILSTTMATVYVQFACLIAQRDIYETADVDALRKEILSVTI